MSLTNRRIPRIALCALLALTIRLSAVAQQAGELRTQAEP